MKKPFTATPCKGLCSTTYGGFVCLGCKRYFHEINLWTSLSNIEKHAVMDRIVRLTEQVASEFYHIVCEKTLQKKLKQKKIKIRAGSSLEYAFFEALASSHGEIGVWSEWGVRQSPQYRSLHMKDCYQLIEDRLFMLSKAHFERYIAVDNRTDSERV